jgi:peptide/nickel transport system permease protein
VFGFVVRRLLTAIVVVLVATIVVFALVSARGDPLGPYRHRAGISQQTLQNLEREYHLNESRPAQYVNWLGDFVQGDWGESFRTQQSVSDMVGKATWNTLLLVGTALILSVVLALFIGVVSAVRQYSVFDHAATSFSYFGFSMPDFFFALLLQLFVIVVLHEQLGIDVLYVQGKYSVGEQGNVVNLIEHMVLPVAVLMLTSVAAWSRYQGDSMLEALHTD